MQPKNRECAQCNAILFTASGAKICSTCTIENKKHTLMEVEREKLSALYKDVTFAGLCRHGKRMWAFIAPCCGTAQTWLYANVRTRLVRDPESLPCSNCGSKRRAKFALAGYLKNHARTYDLTLFEDYRDKVRRASDKTFAKHQDILNPLNLKRSMNEWHLDHKVPIIVCFLENLTIEQASSVKNLQLMDAKNNLSKGKYYFDMTMVEALK